MFDENGRFLSGPYQGYLLTEETNVDTEGLRRLLADSVLTPAEMKQISDEWMRRNGGEAALLARHMARTQANRSRAVAAANQFTTAPAPRTSTSAPIPPVAPDAPHPDLLHDVADLCQMAALLLREKASGGDAR